VDRPLWQIVLAMLLAGTAIQRGAVAGAVWLGPEPAVGAGLALEAAGLAVAAATLWIGGRAALYGAGALGAGLAASAIVTGVAGGPAALPAAFGRLVGAILGSAGLAWIAHKEFSPFFKGASR
jgi:hypothetical protein